MLVYYMDVSELNINQTQYPVSSGRLEKTARYIHQKDKKLSIGAELLLNYSLIQIGIFNPVINHDNHGKPFLKNYPQVHFNLSHSEDYVACALSDSPVGVDIEHIHHADLNIARHYFFGSEYQRIQNSPNKQRTFFEFWVLKESYMKMTGLGFRLGLDEFSIDINNNTLDKGARIRVKTRNDNSRGLHYTENQPEFRVWSVVGDEYMLAVCSESRINQDGNLQPKLKPKLKPNLKPNLIRLEDIERETERETMEVKNQHQRRGS